MRVSVRHQEPAFGGFTIKDLAQAITDGIRGAEIQNGINAQRRAVERLRRVNEATGGALCKQIDELIKGEAAILNEDLSGAIAPDIKAVRTEIGRLSTYIRYRDYCHNPPTGE